MPDGRVSHPLRTSQYGSSAGDQKDDRPKSADSSDLDDEADARLARRALRAERRMSQGVAVDGGSELPAVEDNVPSWRYHLRAFFFPRAHRAAIRKVDPRFNVLAKNPDWFETLSLFLIIANMLTLAFDDPTIPSDVTTSETILLDKLDTFFVLFFIIEATIRLLAFGIAAYWADPWNRLDAVIVLSGAVGLVLKLASTRVQSITVLRALRVLRPLRSVTKFPSVRLVVTAVVSSMKRLVDIAVLFLLFFMCFSAAAVAQYSRHLRKHCVNEAYFNATLDPLAVAFNVTDINDFVCGGRYDQLQYNESEAPIGCGPDRLCGTANSDYYVTRSYTCPFGYSCEMTANPNYGYVGFDNIAMSALTIQIMVTMSSWTQIMYFMIDSTNIGAAVFSTCIIFIGAFFIVNLIVAIMTEEFERSYRRALEKLEKEERLRSRRSIKVESHITVLVRRGREYAHRLWVEEMVALGVEIDEDPHVKARDKQLLRLLDVVPGSIADIRREEALERQKLREHRKQAQSTSILTRLSDAVVAVRTSLAWYVVRRQWFDVLVGAVMVLNAVVLATEHYGQPEWQTDAVSIFSWCITGFMALELTLRFLATHPFLFVLDWSHSAAVLLVVAMFFEDLFDIKQLRFLRLLRILVAFPLLKAFPGFYRWIEVVLGAFRSSLVLMFVILLNLFVFATLGMQLYGGSFCGLREGDQGVGGWCEGRPRANFDAFGTAMLTAFQLMTSDDWQFVMYDAMYVTNPASAILFIVNYFISVYLLNNLFIAILLNSRNDIDDDALEKQLREAARARYNLGAGGAAATNGGVAASVTLTTVEPTSTDVPAIDLNAASPEPNGQRPTMESTAAAPGGHGLPAHRQTRRRSDATTQRERPGNPAPRSSSAPNLVVPKRFAAKEDVTSRRRGMSNAAALRRAASTAAASGGQDLTSDADRPRGTGGAVSGAPVAVLAVHRLNILRQRRERELAERQRRGEDGENAAATGSNEFPAWRTFRRRCVAFANHFICQAIVLIAIIGSTVSQTLASPLAPPDIRLNYYLFVVDAVCTSVFCFESLLLIIGHGLVLDKRSYLRRSWWNVLDFFLAILGVIDLVLLEAPVDATAREIGRFLLPLRPLRMLRRAPGIRVVLGSVVAAIPSIKNILILSWILWFIWGIVGVQLFAVTFYSCSDPTFRSADNCTAHGYLWENADYHFDNIGAAMTTLYVITTFSDWTDIAYQGVDAVGPGLAPELNHNPLASVYFLLFAVIGGIFFVNLFVSVLIDTYEEQRKRTATGRGSVFLTAEQNAWMTSHRNVVAALPPPVYSFDTSDSEDDDRKEDAEADEEEMVDADGVSLAAPLLDTQPKSPLAAANGPATPRVRKKKPLTWARFRRNLAVLVQTAKFTNFINVCIVLNFVVNAQDHYPIEEKWDFALLVANSIFTAIFTLEVTAKIVAFGPRLFVSSKWNIFDLIVVVTSVGGLVLELYFARRSFGSSFRTLRLVRLLRLIKATKRVQNMIVKLGFALYALNNVAALICVAVCVFALFGMRLFAHIKWDYDVIDHNNNLTEFTPAILMMLRLATLDNWNDIMVAYSIESPNCDPHLGDCGSFVLSRMYFIAVTWLFTVVLLNIFVAVIIDTFTASTSEAVTARLGLSDQQISRFITTWLTFDPKRTLMMQSTSVIPFLMALPVTHPFAVPRADVEHRQPLTNFRFLYSLNLMETAPGFVDLWEVLYALCRCTYAAGAPSPAQLERLRSKYNRKNPRFIGSATGMTKRHRSASVKQTVRNRLATLIHGDNIANRYADGRLPVAMRVAAHLVVERYRMAKKKRLQEARFAVARERARAAEAGLRQRVHSWAADVEACMAEAIQDNVPLLPAAPTQASFAHGSFASDSIAASSSLAVSPLNPPSPARESLQAPASSSRARGVHGRQPFVLQPLPPSSTSPPPLLSAASAFPGEPAGLTVSDAAANLLLDRNEVEDAAFFADLHRAIDLHPSPDASRVFGDSATSGPLQLVPIGEAAALSTGSSHPRYTSQEEDEEMIPIALVQQRAGSGNQHDARGPPAPRSDTPATQLHMAPSTRARDAAGRRRRQPPASDRHSGVDVPGEAARTDTWPTPAMAATDTTPSNAYVPPSMQRVLEASQRQTEREWQEAQAARREFTPAELLARIRELQRRPVMPREPPPPTPPPEPAEPLIDDVELREKRTRIMRVLGKDARGLPLPARLHSRTSADAGSLRNTSAIASVAAQSPRSARGRSLELEAESTEDVIGDAATFLDSLLGTTRMQRSVTDENLAGGGSIAFSQSGTLGSMLRRVRQQRAEERAAGDDAMPPDARLHRRILFEYRGRGGGGPSDEDGADPFDEYLREAEAERAVLSTTDLIRLHRNRPGPYDAASPLLKHVAVEMREESLHPRHAESRLPSAVPRNTAAELSVDDRRNASSPRRRIVVPEPPPQPAFSPTAGIQFEDI
jgi:hypothetical protein